MAIVNTGAGALRFAELTFSSGTSSGTATSLRVTFTPGNYYEYTGTFQFDTFGRLVSGTVTDIAEFVANRMHYSIAGISVAAPQLFAQPTVLDAAAFVLSGNDTVYGRLQDDSLLGFAGNDRMVGKAGNDTLNGMAGNDILLGGDGDDILIGDLGSDRMAGGAGADTFVFATLGDSTISGTGRDRIVDFSAADGDRIDLSTIDAIQGVTGNTTNDAFSLVAAFSGAAGEATLTEIRGGFLLRGDVNGDSVADFAIQITTAHPLAAGDFVL